MGQNLVMNMANKGFNVAVYNRTTSKMTDFVGGLGTVDRIHGYETLEDFVNSLEAPRRVMIMVQAGGPCDAVINQLKPLLDKGDIIIDGGNADYADTNRRDVELREAGLRFIGTGVSGGEEGALKGPSIMPGGHADAWPFVKELYEVFKDWNEGDLDSYLIEITRDIFTVSDSETDNDLVDMIMDTAGQKGTGRWMCQHALELGVPTTLVTEAVYARCLSSQKDARVRASAVLKGPDTKFEGDRKQFIDDVRQALYASKLVSYAQGYVQLNAAAEEFGWKLNNGPIALLWRGGCIIRSVFLQDIKLAFDKNPELENLLLDDFFKDAVEKAQPAWRRVVSTAVQLGLPVPAFTAALTYFDGYRLASLPANLLQAQRDYFGAHTYERTDKPRGEKFHTDWIRERKLT
ncbi:UNVERIFIED_CONTAM: hypothetical protein GTU68_012836 [Idotea baltica]|nr:hypothetical protein [Idotea baltica]